MYMHYYQLLLLLLLLLILYVCKYVYIYIYIYTCSGLGLLSFARLGGHVEVKAGRGFGIRDPHFEVMLLYICVMYI